MKRNSSHPLRLLVSTALALLAASCLGGDPWPPPDPFTIPTDDRPNNTDSHPNTWPAKDKPAPRSIFCSAPTGNHEVLVAGLPSAVPRGDTLTVTNAAGKQTSLKVSSDGSFAGFVNAAHEERLELVASQSGLEGHSLEVAILTGLRSSYDGSIDGLILGDSPQISSPDDEGQVLVHGDGEMLRSGTVVVGANTDASTAASTMVSCAPTCAFDLFLPGSPTDELGLFLVVSGQQAGYTEPETTTVP